MVVVQLVQVVEESYGESASGLHSYESLVVKLVVRLVYLELGCCSDVAISISK